MKSSEIHEKDKIISYKPTNLANMSVEEIFKISGCMIEGHTEFYNCWHGNGWIDKGYIIRYPNLLDEITRRQANWISKNLRNTNLIVGNEYNGSIVSSYIARHLNILFAYTCGKGKDISFQKMFRPPKNLNVCFTEDLIFSGTDANDHVNFFRDYGLKVTGISVWVNRQKDIINRVKITSFTQSPFEYYLKESCPLCKNNIPVLYSNVRE